MLLALYIAFFCCPFFPVGLFMFHWHRNFQVEAFWCLIDLTIWCLWACDIRRGYFFWDRFFQYCSGWAQVIHLPPPMQLELYRFVPPHLAQRDGDVFCLIHLNNNFFVSTFIKIIFSFSHWCKISLVMCKIPYKYGQLIWLLNFILLLFYIHSFKQFWHILGQKFELWRLFSKLRLFKTACRCWNALLFSKERSEQIKWGDHKLH